MWRDRSTASRVTAGRGVGSSEKIHQTSRWTLHTFGTTVLATAGSVGLSIITARALGPEDKGAYDLVLATAALLSTLIGLSLQAGITYVVARGHADVDRLQARVFGIIVAQAAFVAAATWGIANTPFARAFFPPGSTAATRTAVTLIVAFTLFQNAARAVMMGRREIGRTNFIELTSRSAHLGLFVLGVVVMSWLGLEPATTHFVWLAVLATGFSGALFVSGARPTVHKSRGPSGIREVIRFSVVSHASNLMQFLNYRLDTFFIGFFSGVGAIGIYTLSATLAQILWLLPQSAAAVMVPTIASERESGVDNASVAASLSRGVLAVTLAAAFLLALAGPLVVPLVFGSPFAASLVPLYLLLPGVVALAPCIVLAAYFAGLGRPDVNLRSSLAGLGATVTLDVLLIPGLGIQGAAIATTVSYIVSTTVLVCSFVRRTGLAPGRCLVPRREDITAVVGAVVRKRVRR